MSSSVQRKDIAILLLCVQGGGALSLEGPVTAIIRGSVFQANEVSSQVNECCRYRHA
jgi:hypothetical protein